MDRKRVLRIPFPVDKDTKMENPLRIPLTPECGKFKNQVSWREIARHRHCDLQIKNGPVLLGHNHVAKKLQEMISKEPCLILRDVLKSEEGRPYLEKIKQPCSSQQPEPKKHVQCKDEGSICKARRTSQRMAKPDNNKHVKLRSNQMPSSSLSPRSRLQRRSQNVDDVDEERENDSGDVIVGQEFEGSCRFAEVVDCGLSVSWEPANDKEGEGFPPKDKEVLHTWKRKKHDTESKHSETSKPKRQRLSVLRLTGETEREGPSSPPYIYLQEGAQGRRVGRSAPADVCLGENVKECPGLTRIILNGEEDGREEELTFPQENTDDVHLHNLDHCIVQFTVGANNPTEVLLPTTGSSLEPVDIVGSLAKTDPSEPIVLSSDDEDEGENSCEVPQCCSQGVHAVEDAAMQAKSPQEAKQREEVSDSEDTQLLHAVVDDVPSVAVSLPSKELCMMWAFSSLYCGVYRGKSNGGIMLTAQNLIIPLKDESDRLEVVLALEHKELCRYSVWEQQEMEAQGITFECDKDPWPPAVLMLCVSQTAAAAAQRELLNLCLNQDETTHIEKASPFMILTLDDPLVEMQGALFRSLLDISCLNSLTESVFCNPEESNLLEDFQGPCLSFDDSIMLIRKSGRECHLLSSLGLERITEDQDGPLCKQVQNTPTLIQVEGDSQERMEQQQEEEEEEVDIETEVQPEEEQREQEVKSPAAKTKEEPTSVYTLCHRRTKGSYSVSLCKPDSNWSKYRHQGLAYRLIQFPPPPLKGGITVTMEDLQCLDSGEFLNDVIIDFYLKYLLHKAAAAVTERCHIFSSFFFKQLTRRDNASEGSTKDVCQRQRRHQRVKTWTRHVDIFKKDFLFVPVNQEAHWYLVVICFPGMTEPKVELWKCPESDFQTGNSQTCELADLKASKDNAEIASTSNSCENVDTETGTTQDKPTKSPKPGPVSCTEGTCQRKTVWKRPCILVMDSLKRSLHERVFKLLRDYLESEWEVRRGSSRDFGADQMQSSHCKVPLQDNSSDCGLYLLQYVESFLKDPVVHFDLPLHLERWFPRQQVRRKRDEIRNLVLNLYSRQQPDSRR